MTTKMNNAQLVTEDQISNITTSKRLTSDISNPLLLKGQQAVIAETVNALFWKHVNDPEMVTVLKALDKGGLQFSVASTTFMISQNQTVIARIEDPELVQNLMEKMHFTATSSLGSPPHTPLDLPSETSGSLQNIQQQEPAQATTHKYSDPKVAHKFLAQFFDQPSSVEKDDIDSIFDESLIKKADKGGAEGELKLLGTGNEKRVYDAGNGEVVILAQPGRQAGLHSEYKKIQQIVKRNPQPQNLAIDMYPDKDQPDTYRALKNSGDLDKVFLSGKARDLDLAYRLGYDLLNGMAQLHAVGFVHGDIKPDNIFMYEENGKLVAKVGDYGKAEEVAEGESKFMFGNSQYTPPEQVLSCEGDVYGTGLLLIRILEAGLNISKEETIERLFPKDSRPLMVLKRVVSGVVGGVVLAHRETAIHAHITDLQVSLHLKTLLWEMTADDPATRPSMEKALERYAAIMPGREVDL